MREPHAADGGCASCMRNAREVLCVRSVFACGSRTIASRAAAVVMEGVYHIAGGAASSFDSVAQLTAIGSVLAALSLLASHNSTFKKEEPNGGRRVRTSAR